MLTLFALSAAVAMSEPAPNTLTPAEKAAGWQLLFDGTASKLRGYKKESFTWAVEDGSIKVVPGAGDLITIDQFSDFEFQVEWKATPKANSGIMYRVAEKHDYTWMTGPEFQVLDDFGHAGNLKAIQSAGAMYDLAEPPADKPLKPAGEWNHARIWIKDGLVKHFLNGRKTAEVRIDGQEWKDRVAQTKFKPFEGFGVQPTGHIALQDHGDTLWYRNIKVRDLANPAPTGTQAIFDGRSLTGWTAVVPDLAKDKKDQTAPWTAKDGVLICSGTPAGYLRTMDAFEHYALAFDWRWSPETKKTGNSGVLLAIAGPDKVWPDCLEAQLQHGRAGDFWNLGAMSLTADPARTNGRNVRAISDAERAAGEWNHYEIIVDRDEVNLFINGEWVNNATKVGVRPGPIGLQSEGAEIHFRALRLAPIAKP